MASGRTRRAARSQSSPSLLILHLDTAKLRADGLSFEPALRLLRLAALFGRIETVEVTTQ